MSEHHLNRRVTKLEEAIHKLEAGAPWKQDETGTHPGPNPEHEGDSRPRQPASGSHIETAPQNPSEPQHPWYKTLQGWKAVVELIAIPFGIGYAVVTYLQWRDLRHNFQVDQRAWLNIHYGFQPALVEAAAVTIEISNPGKSPAMKSLIDITFEIVDENTGPSFYPAAHRTIVNSAMTFPGDKNPFTLTPSPNNPDGSLRTLTSAEFDSLLSGKSYIAVWGQISYSDQFGEHWTRFCNWKSYARIGPSANHNFTSGPCVDYNRVGDGTPPDDPRGKK